MESLLDREGRLRLFHGTNSLFANRVRLGIRVIPGRRELDFGSGFYTTTSRAVAQEWANLRVARFDEASGVPDELLRALGIRTQEEYIGRGKSPTVLAFRVPWDEFREFPHRIFRCEEEHAWHGFVERCRRGGQHEFSWVYGPLAVNRRGGGFRMREDADQLSLHAPGPWRMLLDGEVEA